MKISIYMILVSLFISCSSITDSNSKETIIYSNEYLNLFDYLLYIKEQNIIARINKGITSNLVINNKTIASDSNITSSLNNPYFVYGNLDSSKMDNDNTLNFKWTIDTSSYEDELQFLDEIEIDFEDFDENMNYHLNWATSNNPDYFHVHVQIIDSVGENLLNKSWQLSGNTKSFLIPQSIFNFNEKKIISISLSSYNYKEWEELLAIIVKTRTEVFKIE